VRMLTHQISPGSIYFVVQGQRLLSSGILIHRAVWPQQTWGENWEMAVPLWGELAKKWGVLCPLFRGTAGTGSPSNTMSPGPRPTSVPSDILIHPAVWPQQTWAENWGRVVPLWRELGPHTMWPGPRPTAMPSFILNLDPSNRLATIHQRYRQKGQTDGTMADSTR